MNPTSAFFDQPTQQGTTNGKALTSKQRASIFAGLGGAAALGTVGTALAWGMSQDGSLNDNHPETTTKPANESKPAAHGNNPSDENPEAVNDGKPSNTHPDNSADEPTFATKVNDNMTQEEAFKAARAEVGPGGFFEWHGHYYNTFYKEEWEGMTDQQRQDYVDHVYSQESNDHRDYESPNDTTVTNTTTTSMNNQPDIKVGQYEGHNVGLGDTDHDGDAEVIIIDDGTVGAVDTDNDGYMDTRVELDPETHKVVSSSPLTTTFAAPSMDALDNANTGTQPDQNSQNHFTNNTTTNTSDEPEVLVGEVDGHQVMLEDVDHDGFVDIMIVDNGTALVDTDGDHKFDVGVAYDESGNAQAVHLNEAIDVPHYDNTDAHNDTSNSYAQDYDNNSDVSDWAA
jgi:hypothetical protein